MTVALTGVGGDELFGGYPRYLGLLAARRAEGLPISLRRLAGKIVRSWPDRGGSVNWPGRIKRFLTNAQLPLAEQYDRWISFLSPDLVSGLILDQLPGKVGNATGDSESLSVSVLAQSDLLTYLPSDLLFHTDRVSMAHSLEARVPFLDRPLVEFMAGLPLSEKVQGGELKAPLKRVLEPILPPGIVSQTKMGFSIPLARWLREELTDVIDDCLNPAQVKSRGLLDVDAVQEIRSQHVSGKENRADALWSLLMLELWYREYLDR